MKMTNYKGCVPRNSSKVTCGFAAKYNGVCAWSLLKMLALVLFMALTVSGTSRNGDSLIDTFKVEMRKSGKKGLKSWISWKYVPRTIKAWRNSKGIYFTFPKKGKRFEFKVKTIKSDGDNFALVKIGRLGKFSKFFTFGASNRHMKLTNGIGRLDEEASRFIRFCMKHQHSMVGITTQVNIDECYSRTISFPQAQRLYANLWKEGAPTYDEFTYKLEHGFHAKLENYSEKLHDEYVHNYETRRNEYLTNKTLQDFKLDVKKFATGSHSYHTKRVRYNPKEGEFSYVRINHKGVSLRPKFRFVLNSIGNYTSKDGTNKVVTGIYTAKYGTNARKFIMDIQRKGLGRVMNATNINRILVQDKEAERFINFHKWIQKNDDSNEPDTPVYGNVTYRRSTTDSDYSFTPPQPIQPPQVDCMLSQPLNNSNSPGRRTTVVSPRGISSTLTTSRRPTPPFNAPMQPPISTGLIVQDPLTESEPEKKSAPIEDPKAEENGKSVVQKQAVNTQEPPQAKQNSAIPDKWKTWHRGSVSIEAASQAKQEEKVEIVAHAASTKENLVEASPKVAKQVTVLEKKQKELLKKLRNAQSDLNLLKSVEPKAAPGPEKRVKPAAKATCTVNTWECSSCKKNKTCEKSPKTSCRCIGNGTWKLVSRRRLASHRRRLENRPIHMLAKLIQQAQA